MGYLLPYILDSGLPPYGSGRNEESMAEDRIAHILNEASTLIKNSTQHQLKDEQQQQQQHRRSVHEESQHSNEDSKSPLNSCPSPFYKDQLKQSQDMSTISPQQHSHQQQQQQQSHHRLRTDESTHDKMARLYQEIMSRAPREAAFPGFLLSPFFGAPGGLPSNNAFPLAADDNIRLAFEREMAKLQQQQPNFPNFSSLMALQQQVLNSNAQDLTLTPAKEHKINGQRVSAALELTGNSMDSQHSNSAQSQKIHTPVAKEQLSSNEQTNNFLTRKSDVDGRLTPTNTTTNNAASNSTAASPLSNSILPPALSNNEDFSAAASPLQRMASITNSLITQPPVTPHHAQPQRPTKAVLPPITQQQFDMFNNLNTEDIVRRVKEALSQYSISQRLFGESVLGLSQGSVSDLLARPKPWHMLTQKGRETLIRMKMFLEDENAVHKLVASQYKIAPEKLMRTGSYSGSPQIPQGLANKMQAANLPMQKMMNELKLQEPTQAQHIMQQMQAAAAMSAAMQQQQQQSQQQHQAAVAAAAAAQHHQNLLLTSPGLPPQHAISLPSANSGQEQKKPMLMPIHSPHQANAMRNMHQHMSPTVYEMAALTQDLDTQVITTKIKEALLANNIGQKIFGEAVLGLSQGSVSELLSKPKPWHMLSIKGREPFIRMQLWLSDANNVERLQLLKNERREASKRRRSTGANQQDNSSDTSSNDTNDFYTSSPGPGSVGSSVSGAPPNKKQRVLFSEEQKEALRLAFALDPYPNVGTIEFLANELGLATRTITNWFHNHRMRLKQQVPHGQPAADNPIPSRENTNATPFDPVQFRLLLQQRLLELHKERMGLSGATIPYPPYFAAAALLGRSLAGLPGTTTTNNANEPDLHALNQAFKEQMSGLDLSMSSLKRERNDDYDDDEANTHLSDNEEGSLEFNELSSDVKETTPRSQSNYLAQLRTSSSRRKPAAPQWLNPANSTTTTTTTTTTTGTNNNDEHIINGVCVLQPQTSEYDGPTEGGNVSDAEKKLVGDMDTRFIEPEVHIKQEEDEEQEPECDSENENVSKQQPQQQLQPLHKRLSPEEEQRSTTEWNY